MRCITSRERREVVDLLKKRGREEGRGEGERGKRGGEGGTRRRGGKRATRRVGV